MRAVDYSDVITLQYISITLVILYSLLGSIAKYGSNSFNPVPLLRTLLTILPMPLAYSEVFRIFLWNVQLIEEN